MGSALVTTRSKIIRFHGVVSKAYLLTVGTPLYRVHLGIKGDLLLFWPSKRLARWENRFYKDGTVNAIVERIATCRIHEGGTLSVAVPTADSPTCGFRIHRPSQGTESLTFAGKGYPGEPYPSPGGATGTDRLPGISEIVSKCITSNLQVFSALTDNMVGASDSPRTERLVVLGIISKARECDDA